MKDPRLYKLISALFALMLMAGDLTLTLPASGAKDIFVVICLVGSVAGSAFETYFNPSLPNKILWLQLVAAAGFTAGGLLDHLHVFHLTDTAESIIRFSLVFTWKGCDYIVKEFSINKK